MKTITNNESKCTYALSGLEQVYDPEIGLNVVDLGLIYELYFSASNDEINCIMTLTTEFCPMGESIVADVKQSLQNSFPGHNTEITLTFQPPWSQELISELGREFLNNR